LSFRISIVELDEVNPIAMELRAQNAVISQRARR